MAPVEVQVKDEIILDLANDEEDPVALVVEAKKDESRRADRSRMTLNENGKFAHAVPEPDPLEILKA